MTGAPAWPDLALTLAGAVAELRLNRPAARNAFSLALTRQLIEAAAFFRASTEIQAVIVTGAEAYFSAGADLVDGERLSGRQPTRLERRQTARLGPDLCAAWESLEQVTIAAIEGYCIGGAAALAVALDFRIAGEGAYLRLPEIALGMNMSWGALPRITALVGPSRAKQFAIFCEPCPASEALSWGMIDEVVAAGAALARSREWAAKVAALPPLPVRMTKEAINAQAGALHRATSAMDRDQWMLTGESHDFAEGARAFAEKRQPKFRGD
ncbi:MAG TPA: enoyl-CoA hydratase/isomerase family protein [Caulobacteraceae bacterium]|jgi:enoyl-CoA hydratase/carnithine racemase|nr:enoyl-CoA hydratase/isomerase family protein [Caulobacteraceae bacterium]